MKHSIAFILLLMAAVQYPLLAQEPEEDQNRARDPFFMKNQETAAEEILFKYKLNIVYNTVQGLTTAVFVKEHLSSAACSIAMTNEGTLMNAMSVSLPGIRAGALIKTSIACLVFSPSTSLAVKFDEPGSAFAASTRGTLRGIALGQTAGLFALFENKSELSAPWISGFWMQKPMLEHVIMRFACAYSSKETKPSESWTYSAKAPSLWAVYELVSKSNTVKSAIIYGMRRGIDNSFGWYLRAQCTINATLLEITCNSEITDPLYFTPDFTVPPLLRSVTAVTVFPDKPCSLALWFDHAQKSAALTPTDSCGGSIRYTGTTVKGKADLEITHDASTATMKLATSFAWKPLVHQTSTGSQHKTISPWTVSAETCWKTADLQSQFFSSEGKILFEHIITFSLKVTAVWDTAGGAVYAEPGFALHIGKGLLAGNCRLGIPLTTAMPLPAQAEIKLTMQQ